MENIIDEIKDNEVIKDIVTEGVDTVTQVAEPVIKYITKADPKKMATAGFAGFIAGMAIIPMYNAGKKILARHHNKEFTGAPAPVVHEAEVVVEDNEE